MADDERINLTGIVAAPLPGPDVDASEFVEAAVQRAQDRACENYPAELVAGHLVHVYEEAGVWYVWLNCEDAEFTGLCIGVGAFRDLAVAQAVAALEAVTAFLQERP